MANPIYEAESPDELASVHGASEYGVRLCSRSSHSVKLHISQTSNVLFYEVSGEIGSVYHPFGTFTMLAFYDCVDSFKRFGIVLFFFFSKSAVESLI